VRQRVAESGKLAVKARCISLSAISHKGSAYSIKERSFVYRTLLTINLDGAAAEIPAQD
jgi:hypothetical protein